MWPSFLLVRFWRPRWLLLPLPIFVLLWPLVALAWLGLGLAWLLAGEGRRAEWHLGLGLTALRAMSAARGLAVDIRTRESGFTLRVL
jgi:hypothetical protein